MPLLTARSSTIFIATGDDRTRVYRSVEEVPPELRRRLEETTRAGNAKTILIADKKGEEYLRALHGQQAEKLSVAAEPVRPEQSAAGMQVEKRLPLSSFRTWLELLLPLAIGASLWFFIESRF